MKRGRKKRKKRKNRLLSLSFLVVATPSALALLVAYLSLYITPEKVTFPLFFGLYFLPIFLLNLALLIFALIKRVGWGWLTFIAIIPSLLYLNLFFSTGVFQKSPPNSSDFTFKVCSYNVGLFKEGQKGAGRKETLEQIIKFIEKENIDVVAFQEFYLKKGESIKKLFPSYPHHYYHFFNRGDGDRFGNLTLSRYPLNNSKAITFDKSTNLSIFSDLELPIGMVRLYNKHLESHAISLASVSKKIRERRELKEEIYMVHEKVGRTFKRRAKQVDILSRQIAASPYPVIICGDLNDTPISYTYRELSYGKIDSFRKSGKGFSATYSLFWPFLRIDYIFHPDNFVSTSHKTPKVKFSDHYPVINQLRYRSDVPNRI